MKAAFLIVSLMLSLQAFGDSFELTKDGRVYSCTEKTTGAPTGSLSQLCYLARHGNGQTIYHANGKAFTYSAGTKGATWYYDNGKPITYSAGNAGATWYHSNGQALTYSAGQIGATWYYANGKPISYSMGTAGATIYYEDGQVMTYSAPKMSAEDLLYPCDYIR